MPTEIQIELHPNTVRPHLERMRDVGLVSVEVADTGPGISDEIAERLFQPFVTTKAGGMGIGLSISKRIIESHGGEIGVVRNADGGATFRLTLPAIEDEERHASG